MALSAEVIPFFIGDSKILQIKVEVKLGRPKVLTIAIDLGRQLMIEYRILLDALQILDVDVELVVIRIFAFLDEVWHASFF